MLLRLRQREIVSTQEGEGDVTPQGRDWRHETTSQKLGEARSELLVLWREHSLWSPQFLGFWPPELQVLLL